MLAATFHVDASPEAVDSSPLGPLFCCDIQCEHPAWQEHFPQIVHETETLLQQAVRSLWIAPSIKQVELSVVLGDNALLQRLNHRYAQKNHPTNVLAFPVQPLRVGDEASLPASRDWLHLGDVICAWEIMKEEAAAQAIPLWHHYVHLLIHGLLHTVGYDHLLADEADIMQQVEVDMLAVWKIPSPYPDVTPTTDP